MQFQRKVSVKQPYIDGHDTTHRRNYQQAPSDHVMTLTDQSSRIDSGVAAGTHLRGDLGTICVAPPQLSYVLVTPAHDEAALIELTIRSVITQTVLPRKWLIVSNGSADDTAEIVRRYATKHDWIELLQLPERRERDFAGKAEAFNAGYSRLAPLSSQPTTSWDLIANLDADITFAPDYFEFLLQKFGANPRLGVAGTPFVEDHDRLDQHSYAHRFANSVHVSGACQMFRKECLAEVGGYAPLKTGAIDWAAVTTARMKGWETRTFNEKVCFHHRELGVGSGSPGKLPMCFHYGRKAYLVGGHPLWEYSRGFFRMWKRPFVVGGLWFIAGYTYAALARTQRAVSQDLIRFHRAEQMARLRGVFTE